MIRPQPYQNQTRFLLWLTSRRFRRERAASVQPSVCVSRLLLLCQLYIASAIGAALESARATVPATLFSARNIVLKTVLAISRFRHRSASR